MKVHDLKIWPTYFKAILDGTKTFEVRVHDRSFWVGDVLQLREWDPKTKEYTGQYTKMSVTYIMHLDDPIFGSTDADGRVVMSITPMVDEPKPDRDDVTLHNVFCECGKCEHSTVHCHGCGCKMTAYCVACSQ